MAYILDVCAESIYYTRTTISGIKTDTMPIKK